MYLYLPHAHVFSPFPHLLHTASFLLSHPFVCLPLPSFSSSPLILLLLLQFVTPSILPLPLMPTPIPLFPQLTGGSSAQAFVSKHVEGINWLQRLALSTRLPLCGCHLALAPASLSLHLSFFYPSLLSLPISPFCSVSLSLMFPFSSLSTVLSLPPSLLSLCRGPLVRSSPLLQLKDSHVVSNEGG